MSAVILLSGGQDSATCAFWAKRELEGPLFAVSFDYGQRHVSELLAARKIGELVGVVAHAALPVRALTELADSDLVGSAPIQADGGRSDDQAPSGLPTSFVPGRNLLFLTLAAAYAAKVGAHDLVTGVCQTDYSGYPDCRADFVIAMQRAINLGFPSSCSVTIHTPLMNLTKAETVRLAQSLPGCLEALAHSVTCYDGRRPGCGECPACQLRARGFKEAGVLDPASR